MDRQTTVKDLLTWPIVGPFLRWRYSRRVLQAGLVVVSGLIIFDGLWGPQLAPKNLATVTTWIHYRGLVVLALLLVGNLFCLACPFMLLREVGRWLSRKLGFQRGVPRMLRSKWLAVGLIILYFVIFELYDLWASPWLTVWLVAGYFLAAFGVELFFGEQRFANISVLWANSTFLAHWCRRPR